MGGVFLAPFPWRHGHAAGMTEEPGVAANVLGQFPVIPMLFGATWASSCTPEGIYASCGT